MSELSPTQLSLITLDSRLQYRNASNSDSNSDTTETPERFHSPTASEADMASHNDHNMGDAPNVTIDANLVQEMMRMMNLLGQQVLKPTATTSAPVKSEKTPDVEVFAPSSHAATNTQSLDLFETRLETKFEVNADRYPNELGKINYVFSRLTGSAAESIRPRISNRSFESWRDIVTQLRLIFGEQDPQWYYHQKFFSLRQNNRAFHDFLTEFEFLASKTTVAGNKGFLLYALRNALSRELTEKLQLVAIKDLDYDQLVAECHKFSAHLRSTSTPAHSRNWRSPATTAPIVSPAATKAPVRPVSAIPAVAITTPAPVHDPMDLNKAAQREERRRKGLCFYCGGTHLIVNCPTAPARRPVHNAAIEMATVAPESGKEESLT